MYLLGVRIDNFILNEALEKIREFLKDGKQHYVVLPYSFFLIEAQKNREFKKILNQADLSLSDGVGPVLASYFYGKEKLRGRVMGVDLVWALFEKFGNKHSFFLFGAKEGVAQKMALKVKQKYPLVKIIGISQGYVGDDEVIGKINQAKPEILLVALGMPKQEKWIFANLKKIPSVKLAVGVGGAFDFISGRAKRAPKFMQKIGLEWLWRAFREPRKWRKILRSVIVFPWLVIWGMKSKKIHK